MQCSGQMGPKKCQTQLMVETYSKSPAGAFGKVFLMTFLVEPQLYP